MAEAAVSGADVHSSVRSRWGVTLKTWAAAILACVSCGTWSIAALAPSCAADGSIEVCVVSAAISSSTFIMDDGVDVFVTLRITNKTDTPISVALLGNEMSFMPENAPAITPSAMVQMSGMQQCNQQCRDPSSDEFTTFPPGRPLLVQIRYAGHVSGDGRRMLRSATTASFTATLSEGERGQQRFVPLPTPEFRFGNGLARR